MIVSASKVGLLRKCPGVRALAQEDTGNRYSLAGTSRHALLQQMLDGGRVPAGLPQWLVPFDVETEVPLAIDVATFQARRLPKTGKHRDYGGGPFDVFGTCDVLGASARVLFIGDFKGHEQLGRPRDNDQLRTLATMAVRLFDVDKVILWLAYCDDSDEPRVTWYDYDEITANEARDYAPTLRDLFVSGRALNPGAHCRWCNAWTNCPAVRGELVKADSALIDTASSADLWRLQKVVEIAAKKIKETLTERCRQAPQPLDDGAELRLVLSEGNERIEDAMAAYRLASAYVVNADDAFKLTTSKKALDAVIPKHERKQFYASLRACGALSRGAPVEKLEEIVK